MVRTRARAKLQPTTPESSKTEEKPTVQGSPSHSSSYAVPARRQEKEAGGRTTSPSVEQLALKAFNNIKKRGESRDQQEDSRDFTDSSSKETVESSQPDILLLKNDSNQRPPKLGTAPGLSSSLQPQLKETPYFSASPRAVVSQSHSSWGVSEDDEVMSKSVITTDFEKRETAPSVYTSKYIRAKEREAASERSAGKGWYEMSAPEVTPELQNDLRVLRMRAALDPSQHYKAMDWKKLPRYFQVGRVVSGPAEFYSSRVPRRQRKMTVVEELLADQEFRKYHRNKFLELQKKFSSGTHRHRLIKHNNNMKKFKK